MTNHPNRSKRRYYVRCRRSPKNQWLYRAYGLLWTFHKDEAKQFTLNEGRSFANDVQRGRPEWTVELEPLPVKGKRAARLLAAMRGAAP